LTLNIQNPFFPEDDIAFTPSGPEGQPPEERGPTAPQQTFAIYVDDERYAVPTLYLLAASSEEAAMAAASGILHDRHHLGVELWREDVRLMALGSYAEEPRRR
jgi:hypothetical protein